MNGLSDSGQYLAFKLGDSKFAIPIERVREVVDYCELTKVPRTPDFISGLLDLRGVAVVVIDLRRGLGMESKGRTVDTCIIITEMQVDGDAVWVGGIADAVDEVCQIDASQIAPPPKLGPQIDTVYVKGIGRLDDSFILILDVDRILSREDLSLIEQVTTGMSAVPAAASPSI